MNVILKGSLRQNLNRYDYAINHSYTSVQEIIRKHFKKRMERKDVEILRRQNQLWPTIRCGRINADRINPNSFNTTDILILQINCFGSKLTCSL
jgi:hypothetical protein